MEEKGVKAQDLLLLASFFSNSWYFFMLMNDNNNCCNVVLFTRLVIQSKNGYMCCVLCFENVDTFFFFFDLFNFVIFIVFFNFIVITEQKLRLELFSMTAVATVAPYLFCFALLSCFFVMLLCFCWVCNVFLD